MKLIANNIEYEQLYVNDNSEQCQKEIRLWRAVIIQCIDDLHLPPSNRKYKLWRKQAIDWFVKADQDFYAICEYAKISPQEVLSYAYKVMASKNNI